MTVAKTNAVSLKLNGKPLVLNDASPCTKKLVSFLNSTPADELFTAQELCRKGGFSLNTVKNVGLMDEFKDLSLKAGRIRYWGSPKAIAELRRQVGQ